MPEPNVDDNLNTTQRPGLKTRAANATKHPGKVVTDLIIHRRSHSEVVAARAAAEEAKAAEAKEHLKKIKAIALIRHKLGQEKEMKEVSIIVATTKGTCDRECLPTSRDGVAQGGSIQTIATLWQPKVRLRVNRMKPLQ